MDLAPDFVVLRKLILWDPGVGNPSGGTEDRTPRVGTAGDVPGRLPGDPLPQAIGGRRRDAGDRTRRRLVGLFVCHGDGLAAMARQRMPRISAVVA